MSGTPLKESLEHLYRQYNHRRYVHPDPLEFLYNYPDPLDREIVALVASSLAYGRVNQILKSIARILEPMGQSPARFFASQNAADFSRLYSGFKHRFTTGEDIAALFSGIRAVLDEYGGLEACFVSCFSRADGDIIKSLVFFVDYLRSAGRLKSSFFLPSPQKGSACKRLFLFLRWLVRCDDVDPGGWETIPASALLIPLDTHMFQIASSMGFVSLKQANLKAAIEITNNFRIINPSDPVKYDFVLTRFGIRQELDKKTLVEILPSGRLL